MARKKSYLTQFRENLINEKKISKNTINNHLSNLDIFVNIYLKDYMNINPNEVSSHDIKEFLGSFHIRKCLSCKKSDLFQMIPSIKKFYKFLFSKDEIEEKIYQNIIDICKNRNIFAKRYDNYTNICNSETNIEVEMEKWMMWEDDNYSNENVFLPDKLQFTKNQIQEKSTLHDIFLNSLSKLKLNSKTREFLMDFKAFLKFCLRSEQPLKVSTRHGFLQRKDIQAVNLKFITPDSIKTTLNQPSAKKIHLFMNIALYAELSQITSTNELIKTPLSDVFILKSPNYQLIWILHILWNHIPWEILLKPHANGRPEWSQHKRWQLEDTFSDATVDFPYDYPDIFKQYSRNTKESIFNSFIYDFGVIPDRILPALQQMGIIMYKIRRNNKNEKDILSPLGEIKITSLGKEVFIVLSKYTNEIAKKLENEIGTNSSNDSIDFLDFLFNKFL